MKHRRRSPLTVDGQRRVFCAAGGMAVVAAVLPACDGSSTNKNPDCGGGAVGAGMAAAVPMNGAVNVMTPLGNVFICRDSGGLYAVDAACTHLGCDVMFVSSTAGFQCPCHGATFDFNGQRPTSPAPRPLRHFQLCVQLSGTLLVDLDTEVDPSIRLQT